MGLPAARISDMHTCPLVDGVVPHVGGPIDSGLITVLIGGLPSARIGDTLVCVGPPDVIATGASGVIIGGQPAARITDQTVHGGVIVVGCPTVLIGAPGDDDDDDDDSDGDDPDGNGSGGAESSTDDDGQGGGGAGGNGGSGGGAGGGGASDAPADDGQVNTYAGPVDTTPGMLSAEVFSTTDVPPVGDQIASGLGAGVAEGFTDTVGSLASLGRGVYDLATSQTARADAANQFQAFVGVAGNALQDPGGTAALAGRAVQDAANGLLQARQAAYDAGRGAEFDSKLLGRAVYEVAANAVPGAALHRLSNLSRGAKEAGISMAAARKLQAVAREYNATIIMRPTNPAAKALIELGHPPKPSWLKMKTITDIDKEIGLPKGAKTGELGYFKPEPPSDKLATRNPARFQKAQARFDERQKEYTKLSGEVKKLEADGKIRQENGVIKQGAMGKSFTGDNDIFDIRGADGRQLSAQEKAQITARLEKGPVDIQHPAHMDWDTSLDKNPQAAEAMKQAIIHEHTSPAKGGLGKRLAAFGPNGYAPVYAD